MGTFTAATAAEALEYDFAPYTDAKGTIPEPSDKKIGDFLAGLKDVFGEAQKAGIEAMDGLNPDDPAAVVGALDSLDPTKIVSVMADMAKLYADLCSGKPNLTQIQRLPLRIRVRFFAWLMTEVVRPEAGMPGGNGQVIVLPHAAAG